MPDLSTPADDAHYMSLAIAQARLAAAAGEVPVGAVLVRPGQSGQSDQILARAHNQPITLNDPTAHAEMLALRQAAQVLGNYRLDGCELYVTLEPCAMCAQALLHARLARVVYGAPEPKTGAAGSVINILGDARLNHQTTVQGGVEADACAALMQTFFAEQRRAARATAQPLRDDALRTPDEAIAPLWQALPDDWRETSHTTQAGDALNGLRLHWIDRPPVATHADERKTPPWVLLHGPQSWWPQWLALAQQLTQQGHRVLLPDLIGFGMSDKPKKLQWHTISRHASILAEWLSGLGENTWLIGGPAAQEVLGKHLVQLLQEQHGVAATWQVIHAPDHALLPPGWEEWPYPDKGHQAARKAWPWPLA